jgi:hypothetical protein
MPAISSFTPNSGTVGTLITISGNNFTGTSEVKFGNIKATSYTVVSANTIIARVGLGETGSISVTVLGEGTATSNGFTFIPPPPPTITSYSPTSGIIDEEVNIIGTNFIGVLDVSFGDISATFTVISPNEIKAMVGRGSTGNLSITTIGGYVSQNGFTFIPSPIISDFYPKIGTSDSVVTITGLNFNTIPTNNFVYFGAVRAEVTKASSNELKVKVPKSATCQSITVTDTTTGLSASSDRPFNVIYAEGNPFNKISINSDKKWQTNYTVSEPYRLILKDLDNDGLSDLIVADGEVSGGGDSHVVVFKNTGTLGNPAFTYKLYIMALNWYQSNFSIGDMNGDDKPDIVSIDANYVFIALNTSSNNTIKFDSIVKIKTYSQFITVDDFDGDGKLDYATVDMDTKSFYVFRNKSVKGKLQFDQPMTYSAGFTNFSCKIFSGDLNCDRKPEIILLKYDINTVSIFQNNCSLGKISFTTKYDFATGVGPYYAAVGDLDDDNKSELIIGNYDYHSLSIFRNTTENNLLSFDAIKTYWLENKVNFFSIGELNGDGKPDLAVSCDLTSSYSSETVYLIRNTSTPGNISFNTDLSFYNGNSVDAIAVGDLDGDDKSDVVIADTYSPQITVFLNNVVPGPFITSIEPVIAKTGDTVTINGSNFTDIYKVCFGNVSANSFQIISPTCIKAQVGNGNTGDVSVLSSTKGTAYLPGFTYLQNQTGINETPSSKYLIYPNPFTDYLIIKGSNTNISKVKIFDISGRLVFENNDKTEQINLTSLQPGVYILKIDNSNIKLLKNK